MNEPTNEAEQVDPWWLGEFSCWTMVVLAPILTWFNGPSVSTDQFVVRTAVFCLALSGGIGLRVANAVRKRRKARQGDKETRRQGEGEILE